MPISRSSKPNIVISIGDPSGIGPEVTLKALASSKIRGLANFIVVGNAFVIEKAVRDLRLTFRGRIINIDNVPHDKFSYGKSDPLFGRASIQYLDKALNLIAKGDADALVTAPINKSSVAQAGFRGFLGHTEYLAAATRTKEFAMMFVGEKMKITLVTRHIALKDVPGALTVDRIAAAITLTDRYIKKYFRVKKPVIAVAGLNPHAGEGGMFGDEEANIILPAIRRAGRTVKGILGPIPPDVIFNETLDGKFDAVIALYHDQALIPFKLLYFDTGVNCTIGLPFVRTSPDHGTAFDIAGRGIANASSMIAAIKLASELAAKRGR